MALVLADVGADLILGTFLRSIAKQDLHLKLFVTDVTPTHASVHTDFTEAAGGGYTAGGADLAYGTGWTITTANDPSDAVYTAVEFTFTGALTTNGTIYGYYVTDAAGTTLVWAEKLTTTFTPANNGDKLTITPKLALSTGTPA